MSAGRAGEGDGKMRANQRGNNFRCNYRLLSRFVFLFRACEL